MDGLIRAGVRKRSEGDAGPQGKKRQRERTHRCAVFVVFDVHERPVAHVDAFGDDAKALLLLGLCCSDNGADCGAEQGRRRAAALYGDVVGVLRRRNQENPVRWCTETHASRAKNLSGEASLNER